MRRIERVGNYGDYMRTKRRSGRIDHSSRATLVLPWSDVV